MSVTGIELHRGQYGNEKLDGTSLESSVRWGSRRAVIVNWLTGKLIGCANFLGYRLLA